MDSDDDLEAILAADLEKVSSSDPVGVEGEYGLQALTPLAATAHELLAHAAETRTQAAWKEYAHYTHSFAADNADLVESVQHSLPPKSPLRSPRNGVDSPATATSGSPARLFASDAKTEERNERNLARAKIAGQIVNVWAAEDAVARPRQTGNELPPDTAGSPVRRDGVSRSGGSRPAAALPRPMSALKRSPLVVPSRLGESGVGVCEDKAAPSPNRARPFVGSEDGEEGGAGVPSPRVIQQAEAVGASGPGRPVQPTIAASASTTETSSLKPAAEEEDVLAFVQGIAERAKAEAGEQAKQGRERWQKEMEERRAAAAHEAASAAAEAAALSLAAAQAACAREAASEAARQAAQARAEGRSSALLQAQARGWLARRRVRLCDMIASARAARAAAEATRRAVELAKAEAEAREEKARRAAEAEARAHVVREEARARAEALRLESLEREAALEEQRRLAAELERGRRAEIERRTTEEAARRLALDQAGMERSAAACSLVNAVWRAEYAQRALRALATEALQKEDALAGTLRRIFAAEVDARRETARAVLSAARAAMTREDAISACLNRLHRLEEAFEGKAASGGWGQRKQTLNDASSRHTSGVVSSSAPPAAVLQAAWRGRQARTDPCNPILAARGRKVSAAVRVQAVWRGFRLRAALAAALEGARFFDSPSHAHTGLDVDGDGDGEGLLPVLPDDLMRPWAPGAVAPACSKDPGDGQDDMVHLFPAPPPPASPAPMHRTSHPPDWELARVGGGPRPCTDGDPRAPTAGSMEPMVVFTPGGNTPKQRPGGAAVPQSLPQPVGHGEDGGWRVSAATAELMARRRDKMTGGKDGREGHVGTAAPHWSNAVAGDILSTKPSGGVGLVCRVRGAVGAGRAGVETHVAWAEGEGASVPRPLGARGQARMPSVQDNLPDHLRPVQAHAQGGKAGVWVAGGPAAAAYAFGTPREGDGAAANLMPVGTGRQQAGGGPSPSTASYPIPTHGHSNRGGGARLRAIRASMDGCM